jgi:hypothetical protein
MQDNKQAKRKVRDLENQHVPLRISSVSLFELLGGLCHRNGRYDYRRNGPCS